MEGALAQYYRRPQVSIDLVESLSQRVWILGRVSSPGMYPIERPMRILDAVTGAGGFFSSALSGTSQELADLSHSFLIRKGEVLPVDMQALFKDGDMSQNIYLQPSDYLYFPSSLNNEIYVLGAVKQSRPVGFTADMNIIAAVAAGHGFTSDADPRHIVVVRGSLTKPQVANVNFPDILVGKASNIRLQPNDIVFIPTRWQSSLQGYGSIATRILGSTSRLAISSFASVIGANEGARISQLPTAAATPSAINTSASSTTTQAATTPAL
jgi:polysaccharide biosynthesis/export protein